MLLPAGTVDLKETAPAYRGRFAPTPSGPLHFGSLIAALGSYLQAKNLQGQWLLRIEDIDPPREMPGAANDILRTLELYGFEWDENVTYQSRRSEFYLDALSELQHQDLIFACTCTRSQLADNQGNDRHKAIYPGHCRGRLIAPSTPHSWRVRTDAHGTHSACIDFTDIIQGRIHFDFTQECGDFIIKRRDGYFSYQLAVALDDAVQKISQIVRGADLLDSTPRQIYLQKLLGFTPPEYAHLPVAVNHNGQKLSKQNLARALPKDKPVSSLFHALEFLGQTPPPDLRYADLASLWQWAIANWQLAAVPRHRQIELAQNNTVYCLDD